MRTVIVTGGASGIGLAAVRRFAAAGDRVVILDRDADAAHRAVTSLGGAHCAIPCDMSREDDVVSAIGQVLAQCGSIDVLVNNAGIVDPAGSDSLLIAPDVYRHVFAVNLEGAFVAAREVGRAMLAQGRGAIVNVASLAGIVALPGRMAYSASKAAVLGLTRALASEWGPGGVRVNAVLPGYVATEIVESLVRSGKVDVSQVARRIPLGRLAQPDEIAAVIEYLASDAASYCAGSLVEVDGGYHAFGGSGPASIGASPPFAPQSGPRHVLVTGGASGIGEAIVGHFAHLGDRVTIVDRAQIAPDVLPGSTCAVVADVRDEAAIRTAVDAASAQFGPVDVLINNAGIADRFVPTTGQSLTDLRKSVAVNLTGALSMAQAVAPMMIAQNSGTIINVASIAGMIGLPARNGYCASKAGLIMLTRSLACEWATHGIRVNAVAPGYIRTPGVAALAEAGRRDFAAIGRRTPLRRLGEPAEIAAAVGFLASPAASYMTGTTHVVDGGWTAFGDTTDDT